MESTGSSSSRQSLPPYSGPAVRLDMWLSSQFTEHSRARWQALIKSGHVVVNGKPRKPNYPLHENDVVAFDIPPPQKTELIPEDIPLSILFEDNDIIVIDKPWNLVVHPAPGHASGTLVNALIHHCGELLSIGGELRPGIVHRLDRDTSGVMVVAKNEQAMNGLAAQFKSHRVHKEYVALVWGQPKPPGGTIETLVGRNPHDRKKMTARPLAGRPAVTHYETVEILGDISMLRVRIETGRTHQIRVHLTHIGHPVVGDRQYGRARKKEDLPPVERQMLHAERLAFDHPRTGETLEFTSPLPADMRELIRALREEKR